MSDHENKTPPQQQGQPTGEARQDTFAGGADSQAIASAVPVQELTRRCLFGRNEADGAAFYCGYDGDRPDMLKGIGHIVESQIDDLLAGHVDEVTIVFTRKLLTNQQITDLPDCD
jgi:hypothetical protein